MARGENWNDHWEERGRLIWRLEFEKQKLKYWCIYTIWLSIFYKDLRIFFSVCVFTPLKHQNWHCHVFTFIKKSQVFISLFSNMTAQISSILNRIYFVFAIGSVWQWESIFLWDFILSWNPILVTFSYIFFFRVEKGRLNEATWRTKLWSPGLL